MTKAEAIILLQSRADLIKSDYPDIGDYAEALLMAIEALSAQPEKHTETHACDCISRQAAIDAIGTWDKFGVDERCRMVRWHEGLEPYVHLRDVLTAIVNLPAAQPEIIRCKDCKHNPKETWLECPMSHLSEKQRPETAWCWKAERRTDE